MELIPSLRKAPWKTIFVLMLVIVWNYAFSFEFVKEMFPYLVTAQLLFHQSLSRLIPVHSCHLVTIVEIDDTAYRNAPLYTRCPTDRSYLGTLVRNATDADAAAIALDFQLTSSAQPPAPGQDAEPFRNENYELLNAVNYAAKKGVPVVLSNVLVPDSNRNWKLLPNIFADSQLPLCLPWGSTPPPGCVALGHIMLPVDKRQIALQTLARDWEDKRPLKPYDSLALATVTSYENALQAQNKTRDKATIAASMPKEFVYGRFAPDSAFLKIPATALFKNTSFAAAQCRHHIVVIGGVWHQNTGKLVESFRSPIGYIPGVYFHANYVEALLGDQYQREVPVWFALVFDSVLGICLYVAYHSAKPKHQFVVLLVFLFPLLAGYVILANFNRYLDFVLPLGLCFVHLGSEHYLTLRKGRHHNTTGGSPQTTANPGG